MAKLKKEDYLYFFLATMSLAAVWFIDAILPQDIIIVSLYIVPILIAAYRFNYRIINIFSLASIIVYAVQASMEHTTLINISLHSVGLFVVSVLVLRLNDQKIKTVRLKDEVETTKNQLEVFMNIVAHDLMQPITAAKLYAGMLAKGAEGKNRGMANSLTGALTAFEQLVVDLRDAARIGSGRFTLNPVQVDYSGLLEDAIAQQQMTARRHKLVFSAPKARVRGQGDKERLKRVFMNILSNAVKYSPRGGKIKVTMKRDGNAIRVSVADQGIGMTKEECSALFRPFARQYKGSGRIEGSGLGLYISKSIVEKHKGRIWCTSKIGKGSIFFVELPLSGSAGKKGKE